MPHYKDSVDFKDTVDGLNAMGKLGAKGLGEIIKNSKLAPLSGEVQEEVDLTEEEQEIFAAIQQDYRQEYLDEFFAGTGITDPKERERVLMRANMTKPQKFTTQKAQFKDNPSFKGGNGQVTDSISLNVGDKTLIDGEAEAIQKDAEEDRVKHEKEKSQAFKVTISPSDSIPLIDPECPFSGEKEGNKSHHEQFLDKVKEDNLRKDQELYEAQLKIVAQAQAEADKNKG